MKFGLTGTCFAAGFFSKKPQGSEMKIIKEPSEVINLDCVIFVGGEDISPYIYGEKPLFCDYWNNERDVFEYQCFSEAIENEKIIIGVCRGHQLINALLSGTLYQDIYAQGFKNHGKNHEIRWRIPQENMLTKIFPYTNSMHHQGIKTLGNGLIAIANTKDGLIESTISPEKKILTFQFHPEALPDTGLFNLIANNDKSIWTI